ncbi:MAG: DUF4333 domain-containing protein [Actinomycetota bacterium]
MPSGSPPTPTLVLLLLLSLLTSACASRTLDPDQLERRLESGLADQLAVSGVRVECPDDIQAREGNTLECTARAPGERRGLRIVVTQLDDDGNVSWELAGTAG